MMADNESVTRLIKTARGQMDGVLRMIEKDTYCMDVLNQLLAAQAVLRRAEQEIDVYKRQRACWSVSWNAA